MEPLEKRLTELLKHAETDLVDEKKRLGRITVQMTECTNNIHMLTKEVEELKELLKLYGQK